MALASLLNCWFLLPIILRSICKVALWCPLMADDGSFKGHGGKPGRKSSVISISAHKSRHNAESAAASKKLTGLTLFDFSPSDAELDEVTEEPAASSRALPCENTPFERDADLGEPQNNAPGRKFLRWGLEDGGPSEHKNIGHHIFDDDGPVREQDEFLLDSGVRGFQTAKTSGRNWQRKSCRSASLAESFYHAIHGLQVGFAWQRNVRIHCAVAIAVLVLAIVFRVDTLGWLALILATGFVLFAEFINTAVEHVTDIQANYRYHRSARYAKDTAAAAVLIAVAAAVLVGTIVFVPRLLALVSGQF
jgi:undecaprenol kinase